MAPAPTLFTLRLRADRPTHLVRKGRTLCGHAVPSKTKTTPFGDDSTVDCPSCRNTRFYRDGFTLHVRVDSVSGQLVCRGCAFSWRPRVESPKECPACKARTGLGSGEH